MSRKGKSERRREGRRSRRLKEDGLNDEERKRTRARREAKEERKSKGRNMEGGSAEKKG